MASGEIEAAGGIDHVRRQLHLLAEISDSAVAYLDTDRRFEFVNDVFRKRFGTPDAHTGAGDFFEGVCSPAVDDYLKRAIDERQALRAQLDCTGNDGNTDRLRLKVAPQIGDDGVVGIFVSFDDNESRPIPSAAAGSSDLRHDALRDHLERMARLGEMAAGLTHEIRQPLAAIINYASALKRRLNRDLSDPDVVGLTDHIVEQAQRADNIVSSARSLVGKGQPASVSFAIDDVIDDCMILIERRAREMDVNVRIGMRADLPALTGNPHQIEQIVANLLNNALDAMASASSRTLSIDVDTDEKNRTLRVRVADTGTGIAPDRRESIFNAMETSKNEGMGMGLSVSRSLAERHLGTLRVDPKTSQGAAFVLELPLPESPSE